MEKKITSRLEPLSARHLAMRRSSNHSRRVAGRLYGATGPMTAGTESTSQIGRQRPIFAVESSNEVPPFLSRRRSRELAA
jgi:hypothetical protein